MRFNFLLWEAVNKNYSSYCGKDWQCVAGGEVLLTILTWSVIIGGAICFGAWAQRKHCEVYNRNK